MQEDSVPGRCLWLPRFQWVRVQVRLLQWLPCGVAGHKPQGFDCVGGLGGGGEANRQGQGAGGGAQARRGGVCALHSAALQVACGCATLVCLLLVAFTAPCTRVSGWTGCCCRPCADVHVQRQQAELL